MRVANGPKIDKLAKALEMVFEFPGLLQKGWEAQPAGENSYLVVRSNGTSRMVNLDETMRTSRGNQIASIDDNGLLRIGDWSVLIGKGINHNMHARKLAKPKTYLIFNEKMHNMGQFVLGKMHDGQPISLVDGHLLKVGKDIIPIMPRKVDIQLLVVDKDIDNGKLAYINVIVPGQKGNRENGAGGIFLQPKREGEPAQFVETVGAQKVVTALFQINQKGNRVDYKFRGGETAVMHNVLMKQLQESKEVAIKVGIDPEDYHEYVEISKKLIETQSKWQKGSMAVSEGPELFRPKKFEPSYGGPEP